MKLVRAVRCSSPARLGLRSRAYLAVNHALTASVAVGLAVGVGFVLVGLATSQRTMRTCFPPGTKSHIAQVEVRKYAYEAFPSWHAAHPSAICPRSLLELNEYMNNKTDIDPWGSHYRMYCFVDQRGAPSIVVRSFSEDMLVETADDIWSDR